MAEMTEEELEFERQLARERREFRARKAAAASSKATAERSAAMGGEFPSPGELAVADIEALKEARGKKEERVARAPSFLPETVDEVADVRRRIAERERITTPGGEPEGTYLEEREGVIPFMRPTRIEEMQRIGPFTGPPVQVIRETKVPFLEPQPRIPTETEKLVESFARQPVLTREAGRALAAGVPEAQVPKKVGALEGAVFETPMQAIFRAAPASVEALATEAYKRLPVVGDEPITERGGLYTRYLRGISKIAEGADQEYLRTLSAVPRTIAEGLETVEAARSKVAGAVQEAALSGIRGGVSALERAVGQEGALGKELATLGTMKPAIPSPAAIPDKPVSERIRTGETLADVIRSDPKTVAVYDREFGALAPIATEAVGLGLSLPLPFSPVGVVAPVAKPVAKLGTELAASQLTARAVKQADSILAKRIIDDLTGGDVRVGVIEGASLDNVASRLKDIPLRFEGAEDLSAKQIDDLINSRVAVAKSELARVAPRTDLVRVSPSYAVPAPLAKQVVAEAADDVSRLRAQAKARGRTLTRAEEGAARDAAVARAAQAEARRLDELGQFQVLLDGIATPRVWDGSLARAARAAQDPRAAMKRASVTAAEQEVARKGMDALNGFRREVEAGTKAGRSLDSILDGIASRELSAMEDKEVLQKVVEEAFGGDRAKAIMASQVVENVTDPRALLRPSVANKFYDILVESDVIPRSLVRPNFAANTVKIILEEGVRKRVSKQALADYARMYPDAPVPTLAIKGKPVSEQEFKFFENGAEDLFRTVESIPTRAAGIGLDVQKGLERLAAVNRNIAAKVRIPVLAEAKLLAGESLAAPIRAYLTTRYTGLPLGSEFSGVTTPFGYLDPKSLQTMIDDLGGFGPTRMDVERLGNLTSDILRSAASTAKGKALDLVVGRPYAFATASAIEEAYRRGVFVKALQQGESPEAAISLARRSQFDYGAQDQPVIQALAPYWAGAVSSMAAGAEFVDRVAKNPAAYSKYLRLLREQQRISDPEGLTGDAPVRNLLIPAKLTDTVLGEPVDILGPSAPYLAPVEAVIGLSQTVGAADDVVTALFDKGVINLALEGSQDALDEVAESMALFSAGLTGEAPSSAVQTKKRGPGGPSIDQTYMARLALAKALDPDRSTGVLDETLRLLAPDAVKPPKELAYDPGDKSSLRWAVKPPEQPGAFIFSDKATLPDGTTTDVYYLVKPSKQGRQIIKSIQSIPYGDLVFNYVPRVRGTMIEEGVGEGILWFLGAETIEKPTAKAVEQVRPTP